ncbi:MAG: hypothetical protein JSS63_01680 [Bacteroidetes bacterium]|nr:hypothetical protein [Bacteroidota bacterium]MBX7046937.1 hypothetical protein [Ignavibacteria bacterium]
MIKKISLTVFTLILISASVLYLQSCDIKSPTENVQVLFNTDGPTTGGSISFFDARTASMISSPNVTVKFIGSNAGKITDLGKNTITSFTSSSGVISFGLAEGTTLPLDVSVLISANGFLTTSMPIKITSQGYSAFNMYMVNIANPPDGVSIAQYSNAGTCSNGVLASEVNLTTTLTNGTGGVCKIRLPAGTIITDNSPTPINLNGTLSATIAYFDPTKETALRCFPGGFNINDTSMFSAGFALFDIKDASGREAKKFPAAQPEVTIEIPSNAVNPQGSPIQIGDAIPVFSYETLDGVWKHEPMGVVVAGGNSNNAIKFNTSHLSYWNLDYLNGANCTVSRKIIFNQTGGCASVPLEVKLYFVAGGSEIYYKSIIKSASDNTMTFYYAPSANMKIKLYYNGNLVYTSGTVNLCSTGDLTLSYTVPTLQAITGTVTGVCSNNPNVVVHPSFPVYYRKSGNATWYYLGYMVNGSLTQYCGEFGTYDFMTFYNGSALVASNVAINTTNPTFSFTINNCN